MPVRSGMSRACTICSHPDLLQIHARIDAGLSLNKTAELFSVPASNLSRHLRNHRAALDASTETAVEAVMSAHAKPTGKPGKRPKAGEKDTTEQTPDAPDADPIDPTIVIRGTPGAGHPCIVCQAPNRGAVEAAILSGERDLAIEREHKVPRRSVRNHRERHMAALIRSRAEQITGGQVGIARTKAKDLLKRIEVQSDTLDEIGEQIRAKGEEARDTMSGETLRAFLSVCRVLNETLSLQRGTVETLARITGEIQPAQVNVAVISQHPDWIRIKTALVRALMRHPENVMEDVMGELEQAMLGQPAQAPITIQAVNAEGAQG